MYITIDTSALIAVIGNAFSVMFKRRKISIELAKQALAVYREIPIKFIDVPLDKTLEITHTHNIYMPISFNAHSKRAHHCLP